MFKLKFLLALLLPIILMNDCFGQLSAKLQSAIIEDPNEMFRIRIEFIDNVDCYALHHELKQQRASNHSRAVRVVNQLQQQARNSQDDIVVWLREQHAGHYSDLQQFWIVNVVVMNATRELIVELKQWPEVALIDLENNHILPHDPIVREETNTLRSPNGVEPGLIAINAPAMWALGYTGRGRLVYDYDTGVWPTHAAFAERFMAHRFPLSQCWTGFFSELPNGNISDHGTHTLGTIAGLVEETNDTIGVAFGAYWIANDFVTSTVQELPPLTDMMQAFQWAMDPDGNPNTSSDIPDVINNSWRWLDDPDTAQCAGMVVNLMNAIEAAGIANVFSGGNSGPGNTTVNAPQRINTSEVNTFTVGSVNGNLDFPYPISNFSTRGPTQCPSNGSLSLEIHPEVVAPGQNVRSAWGTDSYNTISGTSMAAPHVSGAVLLLKEAFPYLTGEELLWALYLTAIDLGDAGEDNVYGMGIIDVYAAFQYLAQTNTPVDPNTVPWDLAIDGMESIDNNGITCEHSFSPVVTITNRGQNDISSITFTYDINGNAAQPHVWTGNLASGATTQVQLPAITTSDYGAIGLHILAAITGVADEYDLYNNNWHVELNRRRTLGLPFVEDFNYGFDLNDWVISNEDGYITWDTVATSGIAWSGYSAAVNIYDYSPRDSQKDGMITQLLSMPSSGPLQVIFDVAYQLRASSSVAQDTLRVLASTDCGATFDQLLYEKWGDELSTTDTTQLDFLPEWEWDWRRDTVDLTSFAGNEVLLQFQTTNRKGNNIFVDNIKVYAGSLEPMSINETELDLTVYPNPASEMVNIVLSVPSHKANLQIYDAFGRAVNVPFSFVANRISINTGNLSSGVYVAVVQSDYRVGTVRFVIQPK